MAYEFQVLIKWDPAYFERDRQDDFAQHARAELNVYGQQGWQVAAVTPLEDNRGYAIIMQREQ